MSYAEILAMDVLNIRDRHGSMEEIIERLEKALLDQRETCSEAVVQARTQQFERSNHVANLSINEITRIILNATV